MPIIATLDLHGHVTPRMNGAADVMVGYLTNPHVDGADRGREAASIMWDMLAGMQTCSILIRVPMISPSVSLLTAQGPYADLINFGQTLLAPPLINISILAGFAPADATTNGMSIVVAARADVDGGEAAAKAVFEGLKMNSTLTTLRLFLPSTAAHRLHAIKERRRRRFEHQLDGERQRCWG